MLKAMIALNLLFQAIDNVQFCRVLVMLKPDMAIPKLPKICELLNSVHQDTCNHLLDSLPLHAKISIALDSWTSPNHHAFLAIIGYYIDSEWRHCEVLLGFEHLPGQHTGANMAAVVKRVLDHYKISSRLLCVVTNGATNNRTMTQFLDNIIKRFDCGFHLPCLAHVLQLVA